jgi:PPOX class probable F420-dependent enzyme
MLDATFATWLDEALPAVLTTYRRDGRAATSPVWFRRTEASVEVVIAAGDVKLKHLARRPESALTVFDTAPPFRGLQTTGVPELLEGDVTETRLAIATRYLGAADGATFAARRNPRGTVVRYRLDEVRTWDLGRILP